MPHITLEVCLVNGSDYTKNEVELELTSGIKDCFNEAVQETCDELGEGWSLEDYEGVYVEGFKEPWTLDDFDDLEDFADFADRVEKHGEAYELRAADIGDTDFDFDDNYNGCWSCDEEFVEDLVTSCYDIPDHLKSYIDWEKYARDIMMDYSSYDNSDGYHIFRNC